MITYKTTEHDVEEELFPFGTLKNQRGEVIPHKQLDGKSVALLFCDGSSPKCLAILPLLIQVSLNSNVNQ